jgi:hypothetical protein
MVIGVREVKAVVVVAGGHHGCRGRGHLLLLDSSGW